MGVNGLRATKNDGILFLDSHVRVADISDGTSNTLLIGERPPSGKNLSLGWWYAGWGTDKNGEADGHLGVRVRFVGRYSDICKERGPFEYKSRTITDPCGGFQFWSVHPGGANFAFADGSVKFLAYSANDILPALATRAAGETVEIP